LEKLFTVQSSRFKGDLLCRIYADSEACAVLVPPMMIQPLLENAFLHRPEDSDQPLHIWLTARIEDGFLKVTVSHTGKWSAPAGDHQPANGIDALRQRLKLLLGPQAQVDRQADDGWIRLMICIPVPNKAAASALRAGAIAENSGPAFASSGNP
jgi:LytS/YehU family sensor histidine kinase